MGPGSNYITAFLQGRQLKVRFFGTVRVLNPAVNRGCPMSFRRGVFVLSATIWGALEKTSENQGQVCNVQVRP